MNNISFLIKPASGNCNIRCKYCFYHDEMEKREIGNHGIMSEETMKSLLIKSLEYADGGNITYAFQGGEPTLAGLDFFINFTGEVNRLNKKKSPVRYAIQTNGILIDEEWAKYFSENNYLAGLSLDGTKEEHDRNRIDASGKGTYKKVLKAADVFNKYKVDFNILTVVNKSNARNIVKIYNDFKKRKFRYMQFIPCLEPLGSGFGNEKYSLSAQDYGNFLIKLFDLWYMDFKKGEYTSIRFFDNILSIFCGYGGESCDMQGKCSIQNVIEADGSVYPCDFYVIDEYKLGNINENTLEQIYSGEPAVKYMENAVFRNEECNKCKWLKICGGGCRRHYVEAEGSRKNYFCDAYRTFYEAAWERLREMAYIVMSAGQNRN